MQVTQENIVSLLAPNLRKEILMKVFAIKDLKSNLFYQQKSTINGWYDDISGVRLFKVKDRAEATIKANEHHVSFPGNRKLKVVTISLIEITD